MSTARFRVYWNFDGTREATVEIDRVVGTFSVRPHRRRRTYELPLAFIAQLVAERVIKAEVFKRSMEKAKSRAQRRRARR